MVTVWSSPRESALGFVQDRLRWLLLLGSVCIACRIASQAWIAEDAFITYRTIDNWVHGFGLRWNVDERVQTFTHPLWLLLNSAVYRFTREIPYSLIVLSMVLSVSACSLVVYGAARRHPVALLALVPFLASHTFTSYGTSGFETPLTFFLLALFVVVLFRDREIGRLPLLTFLASLAVLNRIDVVLLVGPVLLLLLWSERKSTSWWRLGLACSPLFLWFSFSFAYYGFLFPNTARAKVVGAVPLANYVVEGIAYTANLFRWDPVTAPVLLLTACVAVQSATQWRLDGTIGDPAKRTALSLGVLLYGAYVLRVGGDFLSGRFWAPPLFVSVAVLAYGSEALWSRYVARRLASRMRLLGLFGVLVLALWALALGIKTWKTRSAVVDRPMAALHLQTDLSWRASPKAEEWRSDGDRLRALALEQNDRVVAVEGAMGFRGMAAGPEVAIVDYFGLCDPLLALLPLRDSHSWIAGHMRRPVPVGYVHARQTGDLSRLSPPLREYYGHLRTVISAPLLSRERWRTLVKLKLGHYDYLIEEWREAALLDDGSLRDEYAHKGKRRTPQDRVADAP